VCRIRAGLTGGVGPDASADPHEGNR
jgi:hypothetical protein